MLSNNTLATDHPKSDDQDVLCGEIDSHYLTEILGVQLGSFYAICSRCNNIFT